MHHYFNMLKCAKTGVGKLWPVGMQPPGIICAANEHSCTVIKYFCPYHHHHHHHHHHHRGLVSTYKRLVQQTLHSSITVIKTR